MKYIITGASGKTGSTAAEKLLEAGQEVVVIGRKIEGVQSLVDKGASAAIGDLSDEDFLTKTFTGADAVYAMIPPIGSITESWRVYQRRIGTILTNAVENAGVKHVVILSSMGSQLAPFGAGPVSGLGEWEQQLQNIPDLNVLALRPGFFMENLYAYIPQIKGQGAFGDSLLPDLKIPFVHTKDIGGVAAKRLLTLDFKGFSREFVSGNSDYTIQEAAKLLGEAINLPTLHYIQYPSEAATEGMIAAGVPAPVAEGYTDLWKGLNSGKYLADFVRTPENTTPTSLDAFAKEFSAVYQNS
ncbi:NAD(P)H-binding protein [Dyadobacter sp. LHD-138]|uniref:NAD(P)H-binding protein n=1 Tax=Dyadobacter sp. LHD-138 TaxID=3071413 RepID=UPI0027DF3BEA|nr:NAD(P)H-binding protein [Dyadobacter sp. LHD-138]MDQ6481483.1 NAD(P)H-binding protein [Dyadobacter sp. LHD-138]